MHGGTRKGAGRPAGTTKRDSRGERVYVRVTVSEKRALEERAARRNMSVSEYLLICSLSGVDSY